MCIFIIYLCLFICLFLYSCFICLLVCIYYFSFLRECFLLLLFLVGGVRMFFCFFFFQYWQSQLLSLLVQLTKYNEAYQYEVSDCFPQLFIILLHSPFENGVVGLLSIFHPQRQREKWYWYMTYFTSAKYSTSEKGVRRLCGTIDLHSTP